MKANKRFFVDDDYELPSDTFMFKRIASMFNEEHEYKRAVDETIAKRASWVRNLQEHDLENIQAVITERVNHSLSIRKNIQNSSSTNFYNTLDNIKDFLEKLNKYKLSLTNKECNRVFEIVTFSAIRMIGLSISANHSVSLMNTNVFSRVERDESIVFPDKLIIESRKDVLNVAQMSELTRLKENPICPNSKNTAFANPELEVAIERINKVIESCQDLMKSDFPNDSERRMLINISSKNFPEIKLQFEKVLASGSSDAVSDLFEYIMVQCSDVEAFVDYIKTRNKLNVLALDG